MSARLVGIGLLSIGGLVAGATGAYLVLRPDVPAPLEVLATPVAIPIPETAVPTPTPNPAENPTEGMPAEQESRPAAKPQVRTMVNASGKPISTNAPVPPPEAAPNPAPATPTLSQPVTQAPSAPVSDPPVATPTPVAAEPPRYVPDLPVTPAVTAQDPPRIEFEELTVAKHSVIGIRLDAPVSTRTARVEDRVTATVSRDVTVAGRTAIAAGVRLEGSVVLVERGGRFRNRPRLGLQFDRMVLADGTRVTIKTDTIFREGDSPEADAATRVGAGAVAGAILGAVIGGKKGAVIGTAAGAAGGAATVLRGDPGEVSLAGGAPLTVRLTEDARITINR